MISIYQHYHLIIFCFSILLARSERWPFCWGSSSTSDWEGCGIRGIVQANEPPNATERANASGHHWCVWPTVGAQCNKLALASLDCRGLSKNIRTEQGWTGFREGVKFVFLKNRCSGVSKERNCSTFSPGQCEKNRRNMLLYLDHSWSLYFLSIHQNWTSRHSFLDSCVWNLLYVFRQVDSAQVSWHSL